MEQALEDVSTESLASFCSHASRPLQFTLGRDLCTTIGAGFSAERQEQQCRRWGVPQVAVFVVSYDDS
jgi:hypothetical protein